MQKKKQSDPRNCVIESEIWHGMCFAENKREEKKKRESTY